MGSADQDKAIEIILGLGQQVFSAICQKDVDSLGRILANDFIHRGSDGSETEREEFLRNISAMPVEVTSITGDHQTVNVYGQLAVMTGVQRAAWRQTDGATGVSSVAFVDVFAFRDDRWLMVLAYGVDLDN